ncbi:MAG: ABC transporter ATP-binding protein [Lachnospiraceae bacterium]|nr:ABC transporter ATP-binding protein [Lachnospiraceae bacterium]
MRDIIIKLENVVKKYVNKGNVFYAIKGVSFDIEKGCFFSLIGKSGSGKSTLLHLMAALDSPTEGKIIVNGNDLEEFSEKERCEFRNKKIGFVFQSYYLEESYSVYKNVEMPLIIMGMKKKDRKRLVMEAIEKVGLADKVNRKANKLSGGEKQRVAIARAIVNKPEIIFADEPCGNLDTENGNIIMDFFRDFTNTGVTVVLVTHNIEDAKKTDRIIRINDGEVVEDTYVNTNN